MRWTRGSVGVLELPDGRLVRGRSLRADPQPPAAWSLHLQGRPGTTDAGSVRVLRWPDFGTPTDDAEALDALAEAWTRSLQEQVEVACRGGVGRTGTALAALVLLAAHEAGHPLSGDEAVRRVRAAYCRGAVETRGQRRWLRSLPRARRT